MTTKWDVYYREAVSRLRTQEELRREVAGRATTILNISIALILAAAVILALTAPDTLESKAIAFAGAAVALWWTVLLLGLYALPSAEKWHYGPPLGDLRMQADAPQPSAENFLKELANTYVDEYAQNEKTLKRHMRVLGWAELTLLLEAGAVTISATLVVTNLYP